MYSLPQVYGDQPFDSQKYLPRCMYSTKPYFETDPNQSQSTTATMSSPILPLPLLPTDIDLKDANIKATLDDVLSRQMLILCRLNQLEQQLLEQFNSSPANSTTTTTTAPVAKLDQPLPNQLEDIVVHFNLARVPFAVFAVVSALRRQQLPVMVNLHLHSSVATEPSILARVAELRHRLHTTLGGFTFTAPDQYLSRSEFRAIVTFVVTATTVEPTVAFNAAHSVIMGELAIARQVVQLVAPTELDLPSASTLWSVLTDAKLLASDRAVVEQLGQLVFNLSEDRFLFGRSTPSLTDAVLWSLSVVECRAASHSVASALYGPQLLNPKWQQAVRNFVSALI